MFPLPYEITRNNRKPPDLAVSVVLSSNLGIFFFFSFFFSYSHFPCQRGIHFFSRRRPPDWCIARVFLHSGLGITKLVPIQIFKRDPFPRNSLIESDARKQKDVRPADPLDVPGRILRKATTGVS